MVRRALQHWELPWLVEQVTRKSFLAVNLERRLERLSEEALEVLQTTLQSMCEEMQVRSAAILLRARQQTLRAGDMPPAESPELSPEVLDLLGESERRM